MRAHPHDENYKVPPSTTNKEGSTIPPQNPQESPAVARGGWGGQQRQPQSTRCGKVRKTGPLQPSRSRMTRQKRRAGRVSAGG